MGGQNIRPFRNEASRTANPDSRLFLGRFLPVDEEYEAGALAPVGRTVASRGPVIQPLYIGDPLRVSLPSGNNAMLVHPPPAAAPQ